MFNIKKVTLLTALVGLAYPLQTWAMNDENPESAGSSIAPKLQALDINDTQEKTPDITAQKQAAQAENEKLEAQIAAAKAKQELEAEQRKTAELQAQLAALQAAQSTPAPAPAPTLLQAYKDIEHGYKDFEHSIKRTLGLKKKKKKKK